MKVLVVYYSLSGNTRSVATALARDLGTDIEELRCSRYSPGMWGYVRAGYDSWKGNLPPIEPLTHTLSQYELVVIAGPIWAWHPATPVRTFLQQERSKLSHVAFLLTHGGAAAEKSLREMEEIVGRRPAATLVVTEGDIKALRFAQALSSFAAKLRKAEAA
jgi:hypothetical protein